MVTYLYYNISLAIPKTPLKCCVGTKTHKRKLQFVCATLDAPTDPTVHKAQGAILSIGTSLPSQKLHEDFVNKGAI